MKKLYKRVITYLLIFILSVICVKPMNVFAYGGFFTTDSFSKTGTWTDSNNVSHAAYVMQDDTNLQTGYRYYMRVADGVAICCDGGEVIANILNYKIGLVMSANILSNFITSYIQDTSLLGREPTFYDTHPPVLKGGNIVGVALNELTGCKMATAENDDTVNIPSDVANDVYNYYTNVFLIEYPETPDYINVGSITKSDAIALGEATQSDLDAFDNAAGDVNCTYNFGGLNWTSATGASNRSNGKYTYLSGNSYYLVSTNDTNFNGTVNAYGLTAQDYTITFSRMSSNTTTHVLIAQPYSISDNTQVNRNVYTISSGTSESSNGAFVVEQTNGNVKLAPYLVGKEYVTVYKSLSVITQITNNVYAPNSYQTNNYKNYSTSNDNSYTTNVQSVNNSTSNNTNIYNDSKTETNETIVEDSYNVNTTTTTTNITNITNNYYGDNGSGGSGGDDDGGDDDDDDDSIWKALLKAIGDFLKKIGELIATVLTGIISILTSVLDAIANITTSFSAITDFLGAVFGFLPSDLVAVITLGVTLGILISLIKMFGK